MAARLGLLARDNFPYVANFLPYVANFGRKAFSPLPATAVLGVVDTPLELWQ